MKGRGKLRAVPAPPAEHPSRRGLADLAALDQAASDITLAVEQIRQRFDYLAATAEGLREWSRTGGKSGYHPVHAANRIAIVLREVAGEQKKGKGTGRKP